jgi:hypothetical protein
MMSAIVDACDMDFRIGVLQSSDMKYQVCQQLGFRLDGTQERE